MGLSTKLPFLFIHGAGGSKAKWRMIHEHLDAVPYQCLDLPGHGENPEKSLKSIQEYAEAINREIHQDVIVVGHSMGGLIGIELAAQNKHIKGLVLVSSHFKMPVGPKILKALQENHFPESLFYASYSKDLDEKILQEEKAELAELSISTTYDDYKSCDDYDRGRQAFSTLKIPILAIYGVEDRLVPSGAREAIVKENNYANVVDIEKSRHYIMLEKPKTFTNTIIHFREKLVKSQLMTTDQENMSDKGVSP